jgi:hypothetical protein
MAVSTAKPRNRQRRSEYAHMSLYRTYCGLAHAPEVDIVLQPGASEDV